jgi:A/G-specific adenine glycosylase
MNELANVPLDEVLKIWEGLGYYARARHLHQAAQIIVTQYNGRIPSQKEALFRLPGVGRYTAGAILSIAFGQDEPAVDGNVQRVLCRLFKIKSDIRKKETHARLWRLARELLPSGSAGPFNQALMDLGASICISGEPRCLICPVSQWCAARKTGQPSLLPYKSRKKVLPHYDVAVGIIGKRGKLLIAQRPEKGLLGGLWEFPGGKRERGESLEECLTREIQEELGIHIEVTSLLATLQHRYSHFKVTIHAFRCHLLKGRPKALGCKTCRWVSWQDLNQYAFPSANAKILAALESAKKLESPLKLDEVELDRGKS